MVEFMLASQLIISEPNYEREAFKYLSKAIAKEYDLKQYSKVLEKRYVDKTVKKYLTYGFLVGKIVSDKQVVIRFEF